MEDATQASTADYSSHSGVRKEFYLGLTVITVGAIFAVVQPGSASAILILIGSGTMLYAVTTLAEGAPRTRQILRYSALGLALCALALAIISAIK